MSEERDYLLGTHDAEVERLGLQHRVWRPRVLDAWRRAGITVGSTVIEKADYYFQQTLKEMEVNQSDDPDSVGQPPQSGTVRGPSGYSDITTDPDDFERGHRAQQVLGALKKLAEVMGGIRGRRKAVVMFSEGIDYPIYDIFGSQAATSVMIDTREAIAAAARANVSFFAVDPGRPVATPSRSGSRC